MKLSARQDIEAPIEAVFAHVTNYPAHEALAARRGVTVERLQLPASRADRPAWKAQFLYGGREREVTIDVTELRAPERFASAVQYGGLDAAVEMELVPLAKTRTRIILGVTLTPRTLKARLVVQSLKLAKGSLGKRLEKRLRAFAQEIESA